MNKIVPIITICLAVGFAAISVCGLALISAAVTASEVKLVAVPTLIIGLTLAFIHTPISFFFKKDRLCFISFFIDLAALSVSLVSLTIWLAAA
ncbi:MAG: hypothetical protein HDT28_09355 [Clostridiales bacterium]|nr:hypothetical protein [Clostridiales bacterium]